MTRPLPIPPKPLLLLLTLLSLLTIFSLTTIPFPLSISTSPRPSSFTSSRMGIIHIVMFEFKEEATSQEVLDVCNRMLALKDNCLHPTTQTPYVKTAVGGRDNSPEGLSAGITHAFISEFATESDRTYYLEKDPAHLAFVASIGGVVKRAQVVDFTAGVF